MIGCINIKNYLIEMKSIIGRICFRHLAFKNQTVKECQQLTLMNILDINRLIKEV